MEKLIIRNDKLRPLRQRHPWIFAGAVKKRPDHPQTSIAEVCDEQGNSLAYGFYSHSDQLVCKLFHFGAFPTSGFGKTFWKNKLLEAKKLRDSLPDFEQTDTYRLCHAEADGIPGLVADVYGGSCLSIQTTAAAHLELLPLWHEIFAEMGFTSLFHRHGKETGGQWIWPHSGPLLCRENGLLFPADPESGQKTGFFIDQRDNRSIIRRFSTGKKVLNAFSYSGGFSVYAIAGGAGEVVSVDISADACRLAEASVKGNFPRFQQHTCITADCFEYLRQMPEDFDLIVLDPPAFAKNRASVDKAARGYKEINLQALRKIKSGGILASFSCSQHISRDLFQKILFAAALDAGREVNILQVLGQPADHPVSLFHPEGDYLKGLLLYVV
jgi:23S rRNA (cytosine1962-C5)-methyltransferase